MWGGKVLWEGELLLGESCYDLVVGHFGYLFCFSWCGLLMFYLPYLAMFCLYNYFGVLWFDKGGPLSVVLERDCLLQLCIVLCTH